jgi:hypothetical protein
MVIDWSELDDCEFNGDFYERIFSTGECFEGTTLRDVCEDLDNMFSYAKNAYIRKHGTYISSGMYALFDINALSILLTAKDLLSEYKEKDELDIPYNQFVRKTFDEYNIGVKNGNTQINILAWLRCDEASLEM